MKLISFEFVGKWLRWSVGASFLLYVILFGSVKLFRIPLKSADERQMGNSNRNESPRERNDIIEYLHKLHSSRGGDRENRDPEKEFDRPFYVVEEVFHKADLNRDNYLNSDELSKWINAKTQEHIHEAIVESYKTFVIIDVHPKNGLISWKEYHDYFLRKNQLNRSLGEIDSHSKMRKMKEAIMRNKAAWSESAKNDPDHLNLDEFLSFRHPESSYSTIISLVDEIYKKFDRDGDEILTEDEFSTLQSEDEEEREKSPNPEERERRREFREMVDLNRDGKATRREVVTYIDPKNPRHAKEEAETLMGLADFDKDGRLSLIEIFNKLDLFLESKMIDTARSFHDEL